MGGLAAEIEAMITDRALVFGSLPPAGRDLDLLARPAEEVALSTGLEAGGFERGGGAWLRLRGAVVDAVDVEAAAAWRLPAYELAALFEEGPPLEGHELLVRPSPHHALLILARRQLRSRRPLADRHRERLEQALAASPEALSKARERAPAWGSTKSLELLLEGYRTRSPAAAGLRAAALAQERGRRRALAELAAPANHRLRRLRRSRAGMIVAFSGLDGSGKSSQAEAIRGNLDRLGISAEVVWTSLTNHPRWLFVVSGAGKWALGRVRRLEAGAASADAPPRHPGGPPPPFDPGRELRRRSPLLNAGWTTLLAFRFVAAMRWSTWRPLLGGGVVLCDRHVLDAAVELRYDYGKQQRFALQTAILRLGAPRSRHAYFLDVDPATASRRKPDDFALAENQRRAELYRAEAPRLGVDRVDGERSADAVTAELMDAIWPDLVRGPRRSLRSRRAAR